MYQTPTTVTADLRALETVITAEQIIGAEAEAPGL